MRPTDQRLEPRNPFARDIDDRLREQLQLVLRQRVAQRVLDRLALARLVVHRIGIEAIDAAPRILRGIERKVGVADERRRAHPRPFRYRDADRRSDADRSEEHTSELQSLMRISYAVFCLNKKKATV